ncbi:MAG: hypothetical protein EOO40_07415 [Deltaproteobacteria bacterium]|nr:MAG: hypothetical protein EOO40_07415 [Deltaproteobacteria bacterium]
MVLQDDNLDAILGHGDALLLQGRCEEALRSYGSILSRRADHVMGLCGAATAHLAGANGREALRLYDAALSASPGHLGASLGRTQALEALGEPA